MKSILGLFAILLLSCAASVAQEKNAGGVEISGWPGIKYELFKVKRIPGDRLIFAVKIVAMAQAPASGTLIGVKVPVPAGASPEDIQSGRYDPIPFSIGSAKMTEEKTGKEYAALAPLPTGPQYIPGEILATLMPGRAEILTVQFPLPPPPVNADGEASKEKQTVSLLLPKAKGAFTKIEIPPGS